MDRMNDPDYYYKLRLDSTEAIATRFRPKVGRTLSEKRWRDAFDQNGCVDMSKVLIRIQKGGVHPLIRGEVWEFLLGCFNPNSSNAERAALRKSRRQQYFKMKSECQTMDSAVGSGEVLILPRINEDGSPVENEPQREIDEENHLNGNMEPVGMDSGSFHTEPQDENISDFVYSAKQVHTDYMVHNPAAKRHSTDHEESVQSQERIAAVNGELAVGYEEDSGGMIETATMDDGELLDALQAKRREVNAMFVQDKKVIQWRLVLHQVGLDVVRTDRALQFYEKPEHLAKLWDILAVYAWIDPDIGYCQGMSDLCSPMVVLFSNEADAFWCFERLMNRLRENFRCTEHSVGVQKQLANLGSVIHAVDPKLHQHLDDLGGGNYIFAFRMVMVLFRREFSFADSLYLWEMIWALEYGPQLISSLKEPVIPEQHGGGGLRQEIKSALTGKRRKALYQLGKFQRQIFKYGFSNAHNIPFVVFCAAGIFELQRARLQEAPGIDDIVKVLNDITGKLDAKKACKEALKIHKKYLLKANKTVEEYMMDFALH
eukprot:c28759_g2_i6 orf=849-2477(+)